jgi:hypothetical protein
MKKIKVTVINKNQLRIEEDAHSGDIIDLTEIQSVDTESISQLLLSEQEKIIKEKIENAKKEVRNLEINNSKIQLSQKQNEFNDLINNLKTQITLKESQIKNVIENKDIEINNIKSSIEAEQKNKHEQKLKEYELKIKELEYGISLKENEYKNNLENKIKEIESKYSLDKIKVESETQKIIQSLEQKIELTEKTKQLEIQNLSNNLVNENKELKNQIDKLKLERSSTQIKKMGEGLEKWCDEQYKQISLSGFENCSWYKDNKAVKFDHEEKSTKADYIFEVFLDENKEEETKLVSICCEMKTESPDSKYKTKNSDHFKKLEDDRIKKNCNYAILISELEWDISDEAPIKRVEQYKNMYVVRPTHFITFITLIKSLAEKYKKFYIEDIKNQIAIKDSLEIKQEFEKMKNTYLDKPLLTIQNLVENIHKEALKSKEASEKIINYSRNIIDVKIEEIKIKIERFDIEKIAKKVDKINS